MIRLVFGNSSTSGGLVIQYTHWSTIWVCRTSPSEPTQDTFYSHSKWITISLDLISISSISSSTGTPTVVIIATNLSVSWAPFVLPVIPWFLGPPINLISGRFTTVTCLFASVLYFVNRTTGIWSYIYFTNAECASKDTSSVELYISLSLHDSVTLLYRNSMSHSDIILYVRCHIMNWYCRNLARHLCTTWVTLANYSNVFFIPL